MDQNRFDRFTETLVDQRSRRAAVGGLLALVTGGLLGTAPEETVVAERGTHGERRRPGGRPGGRPGQSRRRRCRRRPGLFGCPRPICVPTCSLNGTAYQCGDDGCGGGCGTCGGPSPACCHHTCINTATDNNNCGGCGLSCSDGFQCRGGTCTKVPPPPTCVPLGGSCRPNGPDCCGGISCTNNICEDPILPCIGSLCP